MPANSNKLLWRRLLLLLLYLLLPALAMTFVFTSSIAVFGAPFPDAISDEFFLTPLTSYGTQKAIEALRKSAGERDVIVRNAVARALRGGSAGGGLE